MFENKWFQWSEGTEILHSLSNTSRNLFFCMNWFICRVCRLKRWLFQAQVSYLLSCLLVKNCLLLTVAKVSSCIDNSFFCFFFYISELTEKHKLKSKLCWHVLKTVDLGVFSFDTHFIEFRGIMQYIQQSLEHVFETEAEWLITTIIAQYAESFVAQLQSRWAEQAVGKPLS